MYLPLPSWGNWDRDKESGFSLRAKSYSGQLLCPYVGCAICFNLNTKKLWKMEEKNHLQMSSFQAVEIILPLKGVKFCFLSVKNA